MVWKNAFIYTLRQDPADAEVISHKLMMRAGMIQKLAAGIYDYLPLGLRVIRKIEGIIRQEMARCGAVELLMPVVVPAELWQESGRWEYYGPELLRLSDRKDAAFCLGPTHEEVVVDVARKSVRSYRDLPLCLFQIQTKFRDEIRPRFGLMRGREFIMKDAYSFHVNDQSLDEMYWAMHAAYTAIFKRCGLDFRPVEADSGTIGGSVTHEFHVLASSGEDTIVSCDACDYAANIEKAQADILVQSPAAPPAGAPAPQEVATPGLKSIEEVSSFLKIAPAQTIKMLVYSVNHGSSMVGVCIRGDRAVNEAKLRGLLGADSIAVPDENELRAKHGMPIGFIGPVNLDKTKYKLNSIIADFSVASLTDVVCGANKEDAHLLHVFPGRDLMPDRYADVGFVAEGDRCPRCHGGTLKQFRGIEVGQVFKLGTKYSGPMGMTVLNEQGNAQVVTMGCYGIGVGRTAAAAIEQNHDADGIIWPAAIAPFAVAILCLDPGNEEARTLSLHLHNELEKLNIDALLDDRDERPGVKFKDADLIGFPCRVTVGSRGLKEGCVEIKMRKSKEVLKAPKENALERIVAALA
ncbi:MAG: proline--tRNA ligase [Chitinivibrionales bacterium]|nr:proline--tRNA ligase [Chitinivibrionales bacterium]